MEEFITWYRSEPRLSFSRAVVLRYRFFLERKGLAPSTINVRLAAVRRLAYEAADSGLLSPDLAAGIRRVKGAKRLGVRVGNWLTAEQAQALMQRPDVESRRSKRDRAVLAVLLGCGLRRAELVGLKLDGLQIREEHWIIAGLIGKGKHIRTVPVPAWVKSTIDDWIAASVIDKGMIFRRVNRTGGVWGEGITPKAVWHVVKAAAKRSGIKGLAPHDLRRTCARLCHVAGGELDQIQFLLGTPQSRRQSDTSAVSENFAMPSMTIWESRFPDASAPCPPAGLRDNYKLAGDLGKESDRSTLRGFARSKLPEAQVSDRMEP